MDLWFLLFLPHFYGPLLGQEQRPPTLLECCSDGKSRGQKGIHCTILPVISSSHLCRIIQEQCCSEVYHSNLCTNGIEMANDQGACERPFFTGDPADTVVSKMCCDCCVIGLLAVKKGLGCNLGLSLVTKCERAALACCTQNSGVKPKHVTQAPVREDSSIATIPEPNIEHYDCRDSSCSQFCNDDGTCSCKDGYKLEADGVSCEDIDECLTDSHNCVSDQMCINTKGSFRCQREVDCGAGYELKDQNSCQDIDKCVLGSHNCMRDFVCSNTAGSFRCDPKESCREGFLQDAAGSCIDIDECVTHTSPCPPGQTCINTEGSYACQTNIIVCGLGYRLTDSMRCEDVDECRRGAEDVCGDHGCVNLVGTYRCVCRPGFTFNSHTRRCEDINECSQFSGRLCAHKCTNVEGSYRCSCTPGFELAQDGRNCQEVNECEASPCSQECTDVYGSYQCYCRRGYQLSDTDGFTCEDIDECALPSGGQMCSYRCANVLGSFYCTCPSSGYMLALDRQHCQDIDECVTGIHTCSRGESCFNMRGTFRCLSFQCPPNFRLASKGHRNDGSFNVRCRKACQPYDNICAVDPVKQITHTVLSLPNFRHLTSPEEIMFLRTTSPVSTASAPAAVDVYFDMHTADEQVSFDVVKSQYDNRIMGVVRQVKPILGPRDIMLEVAMNYVKDGRLSHRGLVVFHIFISEFWF